MSYNKQTNGYKPKRTKVAESMKISVLPQISVQVRKGKSALGVRVTLPIKRGGK